MSRSKQETSTFKRTAQITKALAIIFAVVATTSPARSQSPREIFEYASPSTVLILAESGNGKRFSLGSGFFVSENLVATNYHVVNGATRLLVRIVGQKQFYRVERVQVSDHKIDLAILKVTGAKIPPLHLASSKQPAVGDIVYVLGNPEGLEGTFTQGNISGIRQFNGFSYLQMSAPISKGSSGGPVLNKSGEVIGVTVASLKRGQNLNFAIPASRLDILIRSVFNDRAPTELLDSTRSSQRENIKPLTLDDLEFEIRKEKEFSTLLKETKLHPASAGAHYKLAEFFRMWGQYVESVQSYNKSIQLKADFADAYYGLAEVQQGSILWNRNWEKLTGDEIEARLRAAESNYKNAIRISPDHTKAHAGLAKVYQLAERDAEAIEILKLAISLDPKSSWLYEELGSAYQQAGNIPQAIEAYTTAMQLNNDPYSLSARPNLARLYLEIGENDKAIENYKLIIQNFKPYSTAYLELCEAIKRSGRFSEGVEYFSALAKSAAAEDAKRRVEDAEMRKIPYWNPSLGTPLHAYDSERVLPHFSLGLMYLYLGDKKLALEQYKVLRSQGTWSANQYANDLFNKIYN